MVHVNIHSTILWDVHVRWVSDSWLVIELCLLCLGSTDSMLLLHCIMHMYSFRFERCLLDELGSASFPWVFSILPLFVLLGKRSPKRHAVPVFTHCCSTDSAAATYWITLTYSQIPILFSGSRDVPPNIVPFPRKSPTNTWFRGPAWILLRIALRSFYRFL